MVAITIDTLGCAGIGMVWGWLAGHLLSRSRKALRNILAMPLTIVIISAQVLWYLDWLSVSIFLVTALFSLLVHVEWCRILIVRKTTANQ